MNETVHAKREIAIQLSAPMVRATLDGTKSVTRRTVKGEIPNGAHHAILEQGRAGARPAWRWVDGLGHPIGKPFRCPHGMAGDMLWGREAWRTLGRLDELPPRDIPAGSPLAFLADGPGVSVGLTLGKFRPGMFMPRWASRILLEVVDVRVERLNAMTDADARAEGVRADAALNRSAVDNFSLLWDTLNGDGAWFENPFIFAISFRRITP